MNRLTNGLTLRLKQLPPLTLSLIAAGVLAVGGLGLVASQSRAADKPATTAKPALTVSVTQAKAGTLPIKLSANGSVMAWQEASVGTEANGLRVAELHAAIGDRVQRGQLLGHGRGGDEEGFGDGLDAAQRAEFAQHLQLVDFHAAHSMRKES